jgi:hypothetical protein
VRCKVTGWMKVCLVKKFAEQVDGVDLRGHQSGEVLDLPPSDAALLVAESGRYLTAARGTVLPCSDGGQKTACQREPRLHRSPAIFPSRIGTLLAAHPRIEA